MKNNYKWVLVVTTLAFCLSLVISFIVTSILKNVTLTVSILVTFLFIFLGILFDIIGVSVTSATDVAFHSMSARRVKAGKVGVKLIKNASRVSSICCDVIGDICGIITGVTGVSIVAILTNKLAINPIYISLIVTAIISSLTIGGKAMGKHVAVYKSEEVVTVVAKLLSIFVKK